MNKAFLNMVQKVLKEPLNKQYTFWQVWWEAEFTSLSIKPQMGQRKAEVLLMKSYVASDHSIYSPFIEKEH